MNLMQMSLSASWMIGLAALARMLGRGRLPARGVVGLWCLALARLLLPLWAPAPFGVRPLSAVIDTGPSSVLALPADQGPAPAQGFPWLSAVWLVGAACCAGYFLLSYWRCRREFALSLPVDSPQAARWLAGHPCRRGISIRQSTCVTAPLTFGLLRPVILLPKQMDWHAPETPYVLLHEYVHIRWFDGALKLALTAALCVHWFNPLAWIMYLLANRDIELACDQAVVKRAGYARRAQYAKALIAVEERRGLPIHSGFCTNEKEERIWAIMKWKKTSWIGIAVLSLIAFSLVLGFAVRPADQSVTAQEAMRELKDSLAYDGAQLSFTIPSGYPAPEQWTILISGRMGPAGFGGGMSVHFFGGADQTEDWQPGQTYAIPFDAGDRAIYTDLLIEASLPGEAGQPVVWEDDLLAFIEKQSN